MSHTQGKFNNDRAFSFIPSVPSQCVDGNEKEDYNLSCYFAKDDVSHGRKGVVCEGAGCPWEKGDPDLITRLEFSTEFGHFSTSISISWSIAPVEVPGY